MIAHPLKDKIKINFNKNFSFSIPIFSAFSKIPLSIRHYVDARAGFVFQPHKTSFSIDEQDQVILTQELSSQLSPREDIYAFWKLAKACHQMLLEIAIEETHLAALKSSNVCE